MFGELSRKYSEHINNLVESVERVSYALFVHEPGHAGHLFLYFFLSIFVPIWRPSWTKNRPTIKKSTP